MPEDDEPLGLDPHVFQGVALNLPARDIPAALAREIARAGSLELWRFQAAHNHDHPFPQARVEDIEPEAAMARAWIELLQRRFPRLRLVVETDPLHSLTWYQATGSAPTEDDADFVDYTTPVVYHYTKEVMRAVPREIQGEERMREMNRLARVGIPPRTGSGGPCERCGAEGRLSDPFPAPTHRGVRFVECGACGARLVHSTRTTRDVFGPLGARALRSRSGEGRL